MNKEKKHQALIKELKILLESNNMTLEEVSNNPDLILTLPNFDKALDILCALDCLNEQV